MHATLTPQDFRKALWACFFAIVLLQPIWYLLWVPARIPAAYALVFALVPLLPGLILLALGQRLAIVAAGVGVLLHFTFATMEAVIYGANTAPAVLLSSVSPPGAGVTVPLDEPLGPFVGAAPELTRVSLRPWRLACR